MNQPITIQGRSLLFNTLFILLNLTGLTFVTIGFHENFKDNSTVYIIIGFLLMLIPNLGSKFLDFFLDIS